MTSIIGSDHEESPVKAQGNVALHESRAGTFVVAGATEGAVKVAPRDVGKRPDSAKSLSPVKLDVGNKRGMMGDLYARASQTNQNQLRYAQKN